jgi:protein TonB
MIRSMRARSAKVICALGAGLIFQLASAQQAPSQVPPTSSGETVEVAGHREILVMLKPPQPRHPREAKGVSGWVRVECQISPQGRVQTVRVVESEPAGLFDQAAIEAMKAARFNRSESTESRLMVQRLIFRAD